MLQKVCLYYHIGQCLAPCVYQIEPEIYQEMTAEINSFLRGNIKEQRRKLEELMREAAEKLNYEKAIEYRQLIEDFETISEKQKWNSMRKTLTFSDMCMMTNTSASRFSTSGAGKRPKEAVFF